MTSLQQMEAIGRISQNELDYIRINEFLENIFSDELYYMEQYHYERLLEGVHDIVNFLINFCKHDFFIHHLWCFVRLVACAIKDGVLNSKKQLDEFNHLCDDVRIIHVNFEHCTFQVEFIKKYKELIQKEYYPFDYNKSNWKDL